MSLILEALKKSEARRQLGEAPGLGTPFTVARRRRNPLPIIVVLVLAVAGFGWYYVRSMPRHPAAGETTAAQAPAGGTAVAGKANPPAATAANPAVANRFNTPAATPRTAVPEPARSPFMPAQQAARGADARAHDPRMANLQASAGNAGAGEGGPVKMQRLNPGAANAAAQARATAEARFTHAQVPVQNGIAQPTPKAMPEAPAAAATSSVAPANSRPVAMPPPQVPPLPAATLPQPAPAPPPAPAAAPPAAADMPLYYELPFNVRKDLPTLTVSMHVFATVPAQRFVVVDGERKVEGETIKEGLTLREIRADGIVLEFRGQKFFYPRPGR